MYPINRFVWLLLCAVLFALGSQAQPRQASDRGKKPNPPKTAEERAEAISRRLQQRLQLSEAQYQQVYSINLEAERKLQPLREERRAMHEEAGQRDRERMQANRQAWQAVQKAREEQLLAVLNDTQRQQYNDMKTKARERQKARMQKQREHMRSRSKEKVRQPQQAPNQPEEEFDEEDALFEE